MKNSFILAAFFFLLFLFSCGEKEVKDGKEIMLKADKAAYSINTASFIFIKAGDDTTESLEKKFWVKRNPSDTILGVMLRAESNDGSVMTYNGKDYVMLDNVLKKAIVPDSTVRPSDMAGVYWTIFNVVLKVFRDSANIVKAGKIESIGEENIDGNECPIVYFTKISEGVVMRSYVSISREDNLIRKIYAEIVKNNEVINKTTFLVKELKANIPLNDSMFAQKIPESYKIEYFKLR